MGGLLSFFEFIHSKNGIAFRSAELVSSKGIAIGCKNLIGNILLKTV
jgi:hypothetical protein